MLPRDRKDAPPPSPVAVAARAAGGEELSEIEWSYNEKREPAISMPLDQKPAVATEQIIIFVVYTIGEWIRQEMKWKKEKDANKSEVSTVFQIALKHNIPTSLGVKVGHEITTGTGPKKKIAKRNASEAMLLQLGYKASSSTSRTVRNGGEQPAGSNELRRNKEEKAWGKQIFMS